MKISLIIDCIKEINQERKKRYVGEKGSYKFELEDYLNDCILWTNRLPIAGLFIIVYTQFFALESLKRKKIIQ